MVSPTGLSLQLLIVHFPIALGIGSLFAVRLPGTNPSPEDSPRSFGRVFCCPLRSNFFASAAQQLEF
jgi:hypothetical protein